MRTSIQAVNPLCAVLLIALLCVQLFACSDGKHNEPPLHAAAQRGDLVEVKRLVSSGINIDSLNSEGATALHWAAFKGRLDVATFLLNRGADVNARTKKGSTPLRLAKTHKQDALVKLLKARGGVE